MPGFLQRPQGLSRLQTAGTRVRAWCKHCNIKGEGQGRQPSQPFRPVLEGNEPELRAANAKEVARFATESSLC